MKTTKIIFALLCTMVGSASAMEQEPENIWVATNDGQKLTLSFWEIDKLPVVKRLSLKQQGPNNYYNPLEIPVTEDQLSLVQQALDIIKKHGKFCEFLNGLSYNQKIKLDHVVDVLGADYVDSALTQCGFARSLIGYGY